LKTQFKPNGEMKMSEKFKGQSHPFSREIAKDAIAGSTPKELGGLAIAGGRMTVLIKASRWDHLDESGGGNGNVWLEHTSSEGAHTRQKISGTELVADGVFETELAEGTVHVMGRGVSGLSARFASEA
jgi:hypothetical protein